MQQIKDFLNESARLKQTVAETLAGDIQKAIELIRASFQKGGKMKDLVDVPIVVPSSDTARIQEVHITIGHIICEIIEQDLIHENKI